MEITEVTEVEGDVDLGQRKGKWVSVRGWSEPLLTTASL